MTGATDALHDQPVPLTTKKGAMPRKRPNILRQCRAPKSLWREVPHVPGLDKRGQQEISSIEWKTARDWAREGLWPGAVGEALVEWQRIAAKPQERRFLPCACCGRHPRALLEEALGRLTGPAARSLSHLISPLDEQFYRHTRPDPHAAADLPWWERQLPVHG